jgi:hypothetical protein
VLFTHKLFLVGRRGCAAQIFSAKAEQQLGPTNFVSKTKNPSSHDEKGRQNFYALLIFPKPMMLELELAPDIENKFNRLPWCHRASPSTTRHESVKSTDTDKMIYPKVSVKWILMWENQPGAGIV